MRTNVTREATKRVLLSGLLAALLAVGLLVGRPAHAATFTVTSILNTGDLAINGVCDVNPLPSAQSCTLRAAMEEANATSSVSDTIGFNISGTGVKTIQPSTELPKITAPVTIDGYTQPGTSLNTLDKGTNANLLVELDGSLAGSDASGLEVDSASSNVVVRGLAINRFGFAGVTVRGNNNRLEGNFIGTDVAGLGDRGNGDFGGVFVQGDSNSIGGASPFRRNLISGNGDGVNLNPPAEGNKVQGNLVGTTKDGTSALGNDRAGVAVIGAERNLVGGTGPGEANTIAFNLGDGVEASLDGTGTRISGNSIFSNARLGIDLRGGTENTAGVTKNDTGDTDPGPNDLQNRPIITSVSTSAGKTTLKGTLNSSPTDPFVVEFYSNPSGNEGKKFIGNKAVSTNADGNATFTFTPSQAVRTGQTVTATATNVVEANTSEFSAPKTVVAQ